jgi:FHS family L-fucose permease-like MFS transporter
MLGAHTPAASMTGTQQTARENRMKATPDTSQPNSPAAPENNSGLQGFVFALFFLFGGLTSLNDVIIPKLKELFTLSYFQAMLVQSAFFAAYFVVSLPGAALVKKIGYMRGAVCGLLLMMLGCLLFIPASRSAQYPVFLLALFVLASGVTIVQVVANPLISLLGPARTAHSRLTFAQAFNSLGTTVFPWFGSLLILGSLATMDAATLTGEALREYRQAETRAIVNGYLGLATALALVAAVVWSFRKRLQGERHEGGSLFGGFDLLRRLRFGFGALCIFLYVGAEVAIGSLIVSYLMQAEVLALDERSAGTLIPLYWGGALLGRFIGSAILRRFSPGRVLAGVALGAISLLGLSANSSGATAACSLLAVGLMNSLMFPTIFSLACEKLGARAADGSGVICVAIVGGAVIPPLTGMLADVTGSLAVALALPALCYAVIAGFGWYARRPA